jgi:uncharacterized protein (TIRG00374 family)
MRLGWRGVLGIALSAVLLFWTMKGVSVRDVWEVLASSNLALLLTSAGVATLSFPIRAWRWRYILHPITPGLPFAPLWRSTAIGMMVNNVAPARAGELARAYALRREGVGVGFAAALGSLVVDRLFDALVVLLLLLAVVALPSFPQGTLVIGKSVEYWLRLATTVALLALAGVALIAFFPRRMLALWDAVAGRFTPRLAARGRTLLEGFASGLAVVRDPRRFVVVFCWAVVGWVVNGLSFWIGLQAVGTGSSLEAAFFLQSMLAIAVSVPSAPGFMGVFEAVTKASLTVYGVPETLSVSFALGYHVLSFLPITVIGFWYFARLGLHFRDLQRANAATG